MGDLAFEIAPGDVANVLASNWCDVADTGGKSIEAIAEEIFPELDFGHIEEAALMADDLDAQTDAAHDEIARQLRDMGVLEPISVQREEVR